jgi:hypothetical protein
METFIFAHRFRSVSPWSLCPVAFGPVAKYIMVGVCGGGKCSFHVNLGWGREKRRRERERKKKRRRKNAEEGTCILILTSRAHPL